MNNCKDCVNFRDTGSSIEGYCACWDIFVLKDDTCEDFEE